MEFQTVKSEPGRLVMTPSQWINRMQAIGIRSNSRKSELKEIEVNNKAPTKTEGNA